MHQSADPTVKIWKHRVRFLLVERPHTSRDELYGFDTGVLEVEEKECPSTALMEILGYIESHPDDSRGQGFRFWHFLSSYVMTPAPGLIEAKLAHEPETRLLEVYLLDEDEEPWSQEQCHDQEKLTMIRQDQELFAIAPLTYGTASLQVVSD